MKADCACAGGGGGKKGVTSAAWIEFLKPSFRDYTVRKPGLKRRKKYF